MVRILQLDWETWDGCVVRFNAYAQPVSFCHGLSGCFRFGNNHIITEYHKAVNGGVYAGVPNLSILRLGMKKLPGKCNILYVVSVYSSNGIGGNIDIILLPYLRNVEPVTICHQLKPRIPYRVVDIYGVGLTPGTATKVVCASSAHTTSDEHSYGE